MLKKLLYIAGNKILSVKLVLKYYLVLHSTVTKYNIGRLLSIKQFKFRNYDNYIRASKHNKIKFLQKPSLEYKKTLQIKK